jgi:GNAT superfamily N-acetyltransferase
MCGADEEPAWTTLHSEVSETKLTLTLVGGSEHDSSGGDEVIGEALAYVTYFNVDDGNDRFAERILGWLTPVGGQALSIVDEAFDSHDFVEDLEMAHPDELELPEQLIILDGIVVDDAYRGQGLGAEILSTLIDSLDGSGSKSLVLLRAESHRMEVPLRRQGFLHYTNGIYWHHTGLARPTRFTPSI